MTQPWYLVIGSSVLGGLVTALLNVWLQHRAALRLERQRVADTRRQDQQRAENAAALEQVKADLGKLTELSTSSEQKRAEVAAEVLVAALRMRDALEGATALEVTNVGSIRSTDRNSEGHAIVDVVVRFGRSLDDKNWTALGTCLAPEVNTDYSSFRGTPPARLTSQQFVELRRDGLVGLVTQHLTDEYRLEIDGDEAFCECNFVIRRWPADAKDARFLHSYGEYRYTLHRRSASWAISGITQHVTRSDGDPSIHGALRDGPG